MTVEIMSKGVIKVAYFDVKDYKDFCQKRTIHINGDGYASYSNGQKIHTLILPRKDGLMTDHINGDRLDNPRRNLRYVTVAQNNRNRKPHKRNKSGFKGVCSFSKNSSFVAQIYTEGKRRHLGVFKTAEEAARRYDEAARKAFGEYAWLNFP